MQDVLHDIATLSGHEDRITAAGFAPGRADRLFSCGKDGALVVWTLFGEDKAEAWLFRHNAPVAAAVFWPDDEGVLLCSDDSTARLIDLNQEAEVARFTIVDAMRTDTGPASPIVKWVSDAAGAAGTIVAALIPMGVLLTATQNAEQKKQKLTGAAADAVLGRVATVSVKPELTVFDLGTLEPIRSWKLPGDAIGRPVFLPDGRVCVAAGNRVQLFEEGSAKPVESFKPGNGAARHAVLRRPGELVIIDEAKQVCLVDLARTLSTVVTKLPSQPDTAAMLGPDRLLLGDAKKGLCEVELAVNAPVVEPSEQLPVPGGKLRLAAGSDDGSRFLTVTSDNRLRVFERRPGGADPATPAHGPAGARG